jgi:hypothetical protein
MNRALAARMTVGPLALVAFFLSWGTGSGPLAAVDFSGYRLVAFTGSLDVLADGAAPAVLLLLLRLSILGVAVAAVWQTLLAPIFRWHPMYAISGWYLAAAGIVLVTLTLSRGDVTSPPAGAVLLAVAAGLFVLSEFATKFAPKIRSRLTAGAKTIAIRGSAG